jgi:hypothetical protein
MKIQAKELRIGNYIKSTISRYRGQPFEVLDISKDRISIKYESPNPTYFLLETVKPIPLTTKWIEKFNFNRDKITGVHYYHVNDKFYISHIRNSFLFGQLYISDFEIKLKHVHQLQNLFFALTGEELTEIKNHPDKEVAKNK